MSDLADIATDYIEANLAASLSRRIRFNGISRTHCRECEIAIPQRRRELLQGVELCVECQAIEECRW